MKVPNKQYTSVGKSLLKNLVNLYNKIYCLCENLMEILSFYQKSFSISDLSLGYLRSKELTAQVFNTFQNIEWKAMQFIHVHIDLFFYSLEITTYKKCQFVIIPKSDIGTSWMINQKLHHRKLDLVSLKFLIIIISLL